MSNYEILFSDSAGSYVVAVNSDAELKEKLSEFYLQHKDSNDPYFDTQVFHGEEDISESNFIDSIISEVINQ